jgi:hypothetical protein
LAGCLSCAAVPRTVAQLNINTDAVKKSVVFLYSAKESGEADADKPLGTGFLVDVPLESQPTKAYRLLVTARHIVDPEWAGCPGVNPSRIYVRLNKNNYSPDSKADGVGFVALDVAPTGKGPSWLFHEDAEVDVAVTMLNAESFKDYDTGGIPLSSFATTDEATKISTGSFVVSAGLIQTVTGKKRNIPIFKFGYVSSIPQEPVDSGCGPGLPSRQHKVWLVAANLVPGNSGSPIFVVPAGAAGIIMGGGRPILAGVQSLSILLADLAGMTPAQYVFDVVKKFKFPDANLTLGESPKPSK